MDRTIDKREFNIVFIGTSSAYSLACLNAIREEGFRVVGVLGSIRRKEEYTRWDKWMMKHSKLMKYCKKGIDARVLDDLNGEEAESFIRGKKCNLICVASACQLLKDNIISIPMYGVINAHGAILPDYRGADPAYWVFRNFEEKAGVTLHFIDMGEDTGDIINIEYFDIPYGMSKKQYDKAGVDAAVRGYKKVLTMLASGTLKRKPQGESPHPQARNVTRDDFILDYSNWKVERAYHFLMGTDGIKQIYNNSIYSYKILNYQKSNEAFVGKYDIQCKNGVIHVERQFQLVRAAKNIVKKILMSY